MEHQVIEPESPVRTATQLCGVSDWTEALYDLITPMSFDRNALLETHEKFLRFGYVRLPGFLAPDALRLLKSELSSLEQLAIRRSFEMPGYATPRYLSVLGGRLIKSQSPLLYSLYHHYALRGCIESIVGRSIYSCAHPEEFMVANFLHNSGDTHGWHLDDPPYAFVVFAEAPGEDGGGDVEIIPNWADLCHRKSHKPDESISDLVCWAKDNGLIDRYRHLGGDAYLLRADLNLHRVAPLKGTGERRSVVNLAFQSTPEATYGCTADLLYDSRIENPIRCS